jgi:sterol desaturase/sphingolipid hydroxylase (fatty acid hydroxylase superfamily)
MDIIISFGLFFLWTLLVYSMHRAAHIKNQYNLLRKIHLSHHKINYLERDNRRFKWYYMLFYFGSIYASLDVILMLTLPAFVVYFLYPRLGIYIIAFHYVYEVFLSEGALDHNPNITGKATRYFAWGKYHLTHHSDSRYNYGLMITLWDWVFKTRKKSNNSRHTVKTQLKA